jgi:hypothetical protein
MEGREMEPTPNGCKHVECEDEPHCLDCCEHGHEIDSHHPCPDCAMDRADAMNDRLKEEGS